MPSATSYSPRSFGCVNSIPELNIRPSIVFGCAVHKDLSIIKRVSSTKSVIRLSFDNEAVTEDDVDDDAWAATYDCDEQ